MWHTMWQFEEVCSMQLLHELLIKWKKCYMACILATEQHDTKYIYKLGRQIQFSTHDNMKIRGWRRQSTKITITVLIFDHLPKLREIANS